MAGNCTNTFNTTQGNISCGNADYENPSVPLAPLVNIITYSIVYGVIFLVALAGNLLVCFVIIKIPDMRTVTNSCLLNLAVSDILFTLITVPPLLAMEVSPYQWLFGEYMCKAVPVVSMTTTSVSIYTMVTLSVDRYYAIVNPFQARAHHTTKRTLIIITVTWLVSFAIAIPQATTRVLINQAPYVFCTENWTGRGGRLGNKIYTVISFAILFVFPTTVITLSFVGIMKRLWHPEEILSSACNVNTVKYGEPRNDGTAAKNPEQKCLSRNKRKTTLMLLVVIIAFLICNSPFNILLLVSSFLEVEQLNESVFLAASILTVLAVCSSACNPFIYNFFSEKFRRAFQSVFTCRTDHHNKDAVSLSTILNLK